MDSKGGRTGEDGLKKLTGVSGFDIGKYLGRWYEIARIDFRFERNLENTTAEYSLRKDGRVDVVNSGYNTIKQKHVSAKGKARFKGSTDVAELEVSFFGPFYGPYNVIALDEGYRYALVAGKNTDYLWLLSREKTVPDAVKNNYLEIAAERGYDVSRLTWVAQE